MTRETDPADDTSADHPGGYMTDDIFTAPLPGSGVDGDVLKPKDGK